MGDLHQFRKDIFGGTFFLEEVNNLEKLADKDIEGRDNQIAKRMGW